MHPNPVFRPRQDDLAALFVREIGFAALFATFAVLSGSYAGGPAPREIFELPLVALNTALLLLSSIKIGRAHV